MKTTIRKSFPLLLGAFAIVTQGCGLTYLSTDLSKLVGQVAPIEQKGDELEDLVSRLGQKDADSEWGNTQEEVVGGSVWTTGVLVNGPGTVLTTSVRSGLDSVGVSLPPVFTDHNPASYSLDDPHGWELEREFDEQVVEPETAAIILYGLYGAYELLSSFSFEGSMSFDFSIDSQGSCMSM